MNKGIVNKIRKYQSMTEDERQKFFRGFEERMIYRTTKTENPSLTMKVVKNVLRKYKNSHA